MYTCTYTQVNLKTQRHTQIQIHTYQILTIESNQIVI